MMNCCTFLMVFEFRRTSCACRRSGSWEGSEDASSAVLLGVRAISNFDSGSLDASTCHRGVARVVVR
jgi:hypothetical protein